MSVINGALFTDIRKFHTPESNINTAVIVIDESDGKWFSETAKNHLIRIQKQQDTLRFCMGLGCKIIVVHEHYEQFPIHIYSIITEPDFSCIKRSPGVLNSATSPPLLPFLEKNNITSLVLMGGLYSMCVRESLIGCCSLGMRYSGILNHQITVLTSPGLLASYKPEMYPLEPKFSPDARSFENINPDYVDNTNWPLFALHPGIRIYTRLDE
ncbi:hypothetical protein NX722_01280 [Endozoicomonas gorgoniicola]|uniref:Isochorismatase-like domain-containing protein n=1 Tax=Endozoicomonas gorgoniicola TaxID=1234144 RepID=A0ABT3MQA2_9GAMM|nr:hypothetical protein [Endozoicomonas gorgoniicola]MCW7551293.1 hypothetical protein [Endozoicomonas gorgoniicola]